MGVPSVTEEVAVTSRRCLPMRYTTAVKATVSFPAVLTVMVTRAATELRNPLFTVRVKPRMPEAGAVKVGLTAVVLLRITGSPETCFHRYVIGRPAGSELRLPLSVTVTPGLTLWLGPAI